MVEPVVPRATGRDGQVSAASLRLRALSTLSGSLTDALTPEIAANLIERQALTALGATGAVVVTLGHFPPLPGQPPARPGPAARLHVVHSVGVDAEVSDMLEWRTLDSPLPFAQVARTGEPLFFDVDEAERQFPEWGASLRRAGGQAAAVVPVWANGELRGVLGLTWPHVPVFDEDERAFVTTLGIMCAQAIMRAHLKVAEREARERAEKANRDKAEFVANVSHELRSPISAVMNYAEVIARGAQDGSTDASQHRLNRMHSSGRHLMSLIDDLLAQARIDSGVDQVRLERVNLGEVLKEAIAMTRPLAEQAGMDVVFTPAPGAVVLQTDPGKVTRIVVNLITNAIKYAHRGVVHVALERPDAPSLAHVRVTVQDEGDGLAPADREHCFEPFWRKSALVGERPQPGSGLGLSISRQLARLLGGDLIVEDTGPLPSTTFILTLPFIPPAPRSGA
jgi:signal transduction histidine kinase